MVRTLYVRVTESEDIDKLDELLEVSGRKNNQLGIDAVNFLHRYMSLAKAGYRIYAVRDDETPQELVFGPYDPNHASDILLFAPATPPKIDNL